MKKVFQRMAFAVVLVLTVTVIGCGGAKEGPPREGVRPTPAPAEEAGAAWQITEAGEQQAQLAASLDKAIAKSCAVAGFCRGFWEVWGKGTEEEMSQLPDKRSEAVSKLNEAKKELKSAQAAITAARGLNLPDWYQDYFTQREQAATCLDTALREADRYLAEISSLAEIPLDLLPAQTELENLNTRLQNDIGPLLRQGKYAEVQQELSDISQRVAEAGELLDRAYAKEPVPGISFLKDRVEGMKNLLELFDQWVEAIAAGNDTTADELEEQFTNLGQEESAMLRAFSMAESTQWYQERFASSLAEIGRIGRAASLAEASWIPTEAEAGQLLNARASDAVDDAQEFARDGGGLVTVDGHGEADIKSAHTRLAGENVIFWLQVAGAINDDCTYQFKIFFNPGSYAFDMQLEYHEGKAKLYNATTKKFTDCEWQRSEGMLRIVAPRSAIGSPPGWRIEVSTMDSREFDATGKQYMDDLRLHPAKTPSERVGEKAELTAGAQWKPTEAELGQLYIAYGTDGEGDVQEGKHIGTICFEPAGTVSGHPEVDLVAAHTRTSGDDVILWLKVAGDIVDNERVSYKFDIFYSSDFKMSDMGVHYRGGKAYCLRSQPPYTEIPCSYQKSGNTLSIVAPKEVFGKPGEWHVIVSTDDRREVVWGKTSKPAEIPPYISGKPYMDFLNLNGGG